MPVEASRPGTGVSPLYSGPYSTGAIGNLWSRLQRWGNPLLHGHPGEGEGCWAAYEVKASTQVKDYQVTDVAFQYFVITRSGLPLKRISLDSQLNNQYVRRGKIGHPALFTIEPMTERILPSRRTPCQIWISLQEMLKGRFNARQYRWGPVQ